MKRNGIRSQESQKAKCDLLVSFFSSFCSCCHSSCWHRREKCTSGQRRPLNQDQRKEKNEKNPKKKKKIFQLLNMQIGSNVVVFSNVIRTIYQPRIISQPRPYFIDSFDLDTYTFLDFAVETGLQRALFRARRLYMKRLFPSVDAGRRSGGKTWADPFFFWGNWLLCRDSSQRSVWSCGFLSLPPRSTE